ncbi:threonylcarbamoyl-AMP synthase [Emydura macquarii macquarii]|uniref:threonylcarbamoyl-AMP synthase n=1 Tax=Emydura macquarii macquarii TaxID=1129001 RepID=UPI00352B4800
MAWPRGHQRLPDSRNQNPGVLAPSPLLQPLGPTPRGRVRTQESWLPAPAPWQGCGAGQAPWPGSNPPPRLGEMGNVRPAATPQTWAPVSLRRGVAGRMARLFLPEAAAAGSGRELGWLRGRAAERILGAAGPGWARGLRSLCRPLPLPGPGRSAAQGDPQGWREALEAAVAALQAGGLVAVPTDTVYGVACLAQDSRAVADIYHLKGRNGGKPLAICLGEVEHVYRYCQVHVPDELLRDLLPGPVTLVLQRSEELNKDLNPFTLLVGVRIPNHPFIREVAQACSGPLALTSANISTQASTLTVLEFQDLWPQLSLVIDGGAVGDIQSLECRLGSTVVDLSVAGKYNIIRPGCALTPTVEILEKKYGLTSDSSSS